MNKVMAVAILAWALLLPSVVVANDEASVRAFVVAYDRAYSAGDQKQLEAILAPDYRVTYRRRLDRNEGFAEMKAGLARGETVQTESSIERIIIEGPMAIVTGIVAWTEKDASGKENSGREHMTMALRRSGNNWQVFDEHLSKVEDDAKAEN